MNKYLVFFFFLSQVFSSAPALLASDAVVSGLSNKSISINTNFVGSDILIFGSIKRSKYDELIQSDIIIEIIGPRLPITVLKKKRKFGIWINSDPIIIDNSPTFYALISTRDPDVILNDAEIKNSAIGREKIAPTITASFDYDEAVDAAIRIRSKDRKYKLQEKPLSLKNDTLFSSTITLPSNLIEGDYETIIYLIQNKKIISSSRDIIQVRKIGLEKWLYTTAHDRPLLYGIFCIILAIISGWGASEIFRRFQQ